MFKKITSPQLAREKSFFSTLFIYLSFFSFFFFSITIKEISNLIFILFSGVIYFIARLQLTLEKTTPYFYIKDDTLFIYKTIFWKPHEIKIEDISDIVFAREADQVNGGTKFYKFVFNLNTGEKFEYKPKKQKNEFFNDIAQFLQQHIKTLPSDTFPNFPLPPTPKSRLTLKVFKFLNTNIFRKTPYPRLKRINDNDEVFFLDSLMYLIGYFLIILTMTREDYHIIFILFISTIYFVPILRFILEKITPYLYVKNGSLFIFKTIFWKSYKIKLDHIKDVVFAREADQVNGGTKFYKFVFHLKTGEKFEYKPEKQENEFFNNIAQFLKDNVNTLSADIFPDFPLPAPLKPISISRAKLLDKNAYKKMFFTQLPRKKGAFLSGILMYLGLYVLIISFVITEEHSIYLAILVVFTSISFFIGTLQLMLERVTPYFYVKDNTLFIYEDIWTLYKIKFEHINDIVFAREIDQVNGGTKFHKFVFDLNTGEEFEYKPEGQKEEFFNENEFFNEIAQFLKDNINTLPSHTFPDFPLSLASKRKSIRNAKILTAISLVILISLIFFIFHQIK